MTSRSVHTLSTHNAPINQIAMVNWTQLLAVATQGGVNVYDIERVMQGQSMNDRGRGGATDLPFCTIDLTDRTDEVTRCLNMLTPVSNG